MARSLYICYFGVREPLVQTQVIAYLRVLAGRGHDISLLTFDAGTSNDDQEVKERLAGDGIRWFSLKYHRRFSVIATMYDVLRGAYFVRGFIRRERVSIVHGRAQVATLIGALGAKLSARRPKLLFDIRGLLAEEYTDAGIWPRGGFLFRSAKKVEAWLMARSDGFVILTERLRQHFFPGSADGGFDDAGRPVEVIPCCCDVPALLASQSCGWRKEAGAGGRTVLVYVGSFGGWYLSDELVAFVSKAREIDPNLFFLVLTQRGLGDVRSRIESAGISSADFQVRSVPPHVIGSYLAECDIAISLIKPCFSKIASSPTKLAEYLACGLPVIANPGIGDVDTIIGQENVGVMMRSFDDKGYLEAFRAALALKRQPDIVQRCKTSAMKNFDLHTVAAPRYDRLYKELDKGETGS